MTAPTKILATIGLCVLMALCGCGDDTYVEEIDSGAIDKSALLEKMNTDRQKKAKKRDLQAEFVYSSIGKRDPFRSYLADLATIKEETALPLQDTEKFELDQYRLTGLVTGTSQPKAMVEDPEGVGHTLRVGARLGRHGGRVTRISAKGVVIVEETVNPLGQKVRIPITLRLPEDPNALNIKLQ